MAKEDWLKITLDDIRILIDEAGRSERAVADDEDPDYLGQASPESIITMLANDATGHFHEQFVNDLNANLPKLTKMSFLDDSVTELIIAGLKWGIADRCGASANCLGAFYYNGQFVEQDYAKAAELYELAMDFGNVQAVINLGYIYEYGRLGERDMTKAFMYYSQAAALTQASEALCKMGDMFSRGHGIPANKKTAFSLWERALDRAHSMQELAQPAFRLASLYLEGSYELGIDADPFYALRLYQQAELGMRKDIDVGAEYYRKRLREAIEGQEAAREKLSEVRFV